MGCNGGTGCCSPRGRIPTRARRRLKTTGLRTQRLPADAGRPRRLSQLSGTYDSSRVVFGSNDETIKIWDTQTGLCLSVNPRPWLRLFRSFFRHRWFFTSHLCRNYRTARLTVTRPENFQTGSPVRQTFKHFQATNCREPRHTEGMVVSVLIGFGLFSVHRPGYGSLLCIAQSVWP